MKLKGEKKNSLVRLLKERDNKVWVLLTTFFVKHIKKEIAKESYMEKRKNKRRRLEKREQSVAAFDKGEVRGAKRAMPPNFLKFPLKSEIKLQFKQKIY